jgi:hypothetical protein
MMFPGEMIYKLARIIVLIISQIARMIPKEISNSEHAIRKEDIPGKMK